MGAITNLNNNKALNCYNDFGRLFTNTTYSAKCAGQVNTALTVPLGSGIGKANDTNPKFLAIISYEPDLGGNLEVLVAVNNVITVVLNPTFGAAKAVINPEAIEVKGGDVIRFFPFVATNISVEFYAI